MGKGYLRTGAGLCAVGSVAPEGKAADGVSLPRARGRAWAPALPPPLRGANAASR